MMKKTLIATALVVTVAGAGVFAAKQSFADTNGQSRISTLVQELATKFGLKTADVQAVFDQHRTEMQTNMLTNRQTKLDQDVKDGKITADQEKLIIAKDAELAANRQAEVAKLKTMTPVERKAELTAEKTALDDWATQNKIDPKYLMIGRGFRGGFRGPGRSEVNENSEVPATPTPSPTPAQ